ncbi:GTP diphosphokinase [Porticoccus sp. W117]|uniref:GTP diphosphokinase n=1 Tax=Porticoccus sp. W117 TaxID=3054777 RepID=UPI0025955104|nr:GTP diphosphokinase [Porticoccus sp. W117]MDM3869820.1 GTP diphosphokinase [Porticoccus sp. W117]
MVQIRDNHPLNYAGEIDPGYWVDLLAENARLENDERAELLRACEFVQQVELQNSDDSKALAPGISTLPAGLEMAVILADLHLDCAGLSAAILYRAVREDKVPLQVVEKYFGATVAKLIGSVLQMAVVSTLRNDSGDRVFGHERGQQAAKVREMLVSVIDDVRVALIKISERACAIRAAKNAPEEKRVRVAREIFDVYAPLAHRLGIGHLKWELEDMAFRYLNPEEYKHIARLLDERRIDRQEFIEDVLNTLNRELAEAGIEGEINGRAKHIYSIWRKMQRKQISFSQVYDIRAVRVLVYSQAECYGVLGIVHSLWRNVPHEFDDYIASPKENGYRSLHTAVIGPHSKVLEIQIRTHEMHEEAELGVCAHWRYKGSDKKSSADSYEEKVSWLRQVLEWHEEIEGGQEVQDLLQSASQPDRIYVFTPDGHVIDLPLGSTPLDFAYRIHTQVGHSCRGAKVNGRMLPLNTPLKTSDQVTIITGSQEAPSRDWLLPSLGYLHTASARGKVQQWFRHQDRDKNIQAGRAIVSRELKQLGIGNPDFEPLAKRFNKQGEEGIYAAIGAGDIGLVQFLNAVQAQLGSDRESEFLPIKRAEGTSRYQQSDVYIHGVGNLMSHMAQCCNPVPGEAISGYITQGRGVSVHRADCGNLLRLQIEEPERVIQVQWGGAPQQVYPVNIRATAYERSGLMRDISAVLDRLGVQIVDLSAHRKTDGGDLVFNVNMRLEVTGLEQLSEVMGKLRQLANLIDIERVHES